MKSILNWAPKIWGIIYASLIPIFALIYCMMPDGSFLGITSDGISWFEHLYNSIYFSVITITTLGYGDMCPLTFCAKAAVILETTLGMLVIGMFLNSVATMKSKIDLEIESKKQDRIRKNTEVTKLVRQFLLLKEDILEYIRLATKITTPGYHGNTPYSYNEDFKFQDLREMYRITGQFQDSLSEPAINIYFRTQKDMANRFESVLTNVDMSYWPNLEKKILDVLHNIKIYNCEGFIVSQPSMVAGDKKLSDVWMEQVRDWNKEVEYENQSAINPYISLYKLIKVNMPLIISIMGEIENIVKEDNN